MRTFFLIARFFKKK